MPEFPGIPTRELKRISSTEFERQDLYLVKCRDTWVSVTPKVAARWEGETAVGTGDVAIAAAAAADGVPASLYHPEHWDAYTLTLKTNVNAPDDALEYTKRSGQPIDASVYAISAFRRGRTVVGWNGTYVIDGQWAFYSGKLTYDPVAAQEMLKNFADQKESRRKYNPTARMQGSKLSYRTLRMIAERLAYALCGTPLVTQGPGGAQLFRFRAFGRTIAGLVWSIPRAAGILRQFPGLHPDFREDDPNRYGWGSWAKIIRGLAAQLKDPLMTPEFRRFVRSELRRLPKEKSCRPSTSPSAQSPAPAMR